MRIKRRGTAGLLGLIMLFELSAFGLLTFKDGALDLNAALVGIIMVGLLAFQYYALTSFFKHVDQYILIIANMLVGIGIIVQYRLNPSLAFKQLIWFGVGMLLMIIAIVLMRRIELFKRIRWALIAASIGLLALPLAFGSYTGGAKNWLNFGSFSFQPSEYVKVILVIVLAAWLSEKTTLAQLLAPLGLLFVAIVELMVARDLGAAVLYFGTGIILYFVATGNKLITALGLGAGAAGAVGSYYIFSHVRARVAVWKNPWASYYAQGYQIAQGLMAIASGGLWGLGLTRGSPKSIPAYSTDYIFAVICEEFGIIVGVCIVAFYLIFIIRGAIIALNAPERFSMLVAFGCTVLITLQSFIIIGGVIKLIPLTGITLPFVSYGGSSLTTSMVLLGMLEAVAISGGEAREQREGLSK